MNLKTVTLADLEPHPDNPNTHPEKQINALGDSLNEFDQVKNVVIWRGMMLAGHAVREAAMKSGRLTLDAVDVSHWDEQKAKAFMLADIRLPDMGVYDEAAMAEVLRAIDEPLDIPGFDEDFLARMGGLDGFQPVDPSTQPRLDQKSPIECPHCGAEFVPK
jgi:ParB-like chromosome segregation protein Spo0J